METNSENNNFENLELHQNLIKGVYIYGFKKPSKIQVKGIQAINTGKDCIIQSQSGTGKTATYLLGILNRLEENDKCQAIIIAPTRELATQVYKVANEICKFTEYKIELCTGGTSINKNRSNLKKTNLVIGTMGRINHMIQENRINLYNIKLIALDEADDLLDALEASRDRRRTALMIMAAMKGNRKALRQLDNMFGFM